MSYIFFSYASEDRARVAVIAKALEKVGHTVWWDRQIPIGEPFSAYIQKKLDGAGCVIVAWSENTGNSYWVADEAGRARDRGVLLPILIDEEGPPMGFQSIQAAKLADWSDDSGHPEWVRLLKGLESYFPPGIGQKKPNEPEKETTPAKETKPKDEVGRKTPAAVQHLPLTGGASFLVGHAKDSMRPDHSYLGLNHWLVVLLERHRGMAERFAGGADLKAVLGDASRSIHDGNLGEALTVEDLLGRADEAAHHRGNDQIWERDLALVLMEAAGLT